MTETETIQDPRDYKITALKERISKLVADYEDQDANRRVEITFASIRIAELEKRIEELENPTEEDGSDQLPNK